MAPSQPQPIAWAPMDALDGVKSRSRSVLTLNRGKGAENIELNLNSRVCFDGLPEGDVAHFWKALNSRWGIGRAGPWFSEKHKGLKVGFVSMEGGKDAAEEKLAETAASGVHVLVVSTEVLVQSCTVVEACRQFSNLLLVIDEAAGALKEASLMELLQKIDVHSRWSVKATGDVAGTLLAVSAPALNGSSGAGESGAHTGGSTGILRLNNVQIPLPDEDEATEPLPGLFSLLRNQMERLYTDSLGASIANLRVSQREYGIQLAMLVRYAEDDTLELLGFVIYKNWSLEDQFSLASVGAVAVPEHLRGRGYGRMLIEIAEEQAALVANECNAAYGKVCLCALQTSVRFFERLGFRILPSEGSDESPEVDEVVGDEPDLEAPCVSMFRAVAASGSKVNSSGGKKRPLVRAVQMAPAPAAEPYNPKRGEHICEGPPWLRRDQLMDTGCVMIPNVEIQDQDFEEENDFLQFLQALIWEKVDEIMEGSFKADATHLQSAQREYGLQVTLLVKMTSEFEELDLIGFLAHKTWSAPEEGECEEEAEALQARVSVAAMGVSERYRGLGWGRALLNIAEDQAAEAARESNAESGRLCLSTSQSSLKFFEHLGFEVDEEGDSEDAEEEEEDGPRVRLFRDCPASMPTGSKRIARTVDITSVPVTEPMCRARARHLESGPEWMPVDELLGEDAASQEQADRAKLVAQASASGLGRGVLLLPYTHITDVDVFEKNNFLRGVHHSLWKQLEFPGKDTGVGAANLQVAQRDYGMQVTLLVKLNADFEEGLELVGFIAYKPWAGTARVSVGSLCITEARRGCGYGRLLLNIAEDHAAEAARESGAESGRVCLSSSRSSLKFFEHVGYEALPQEGATKGKFNGQVKGDDGPRIPMFRDCPAASTSCRGKYRFLRSISLGMSPKLQQFCEKTAQHIEGGPVWKPAKELSG